MSFRHELIGKINFGTEVNDILRLNGIENTYKFICPSEEDVEDLSVLDNIETAADIIIENCYQCNNIGILVDCDADGYTSAAMLYSFLKRLFEVTPFTSYIHSGKQHGLSDREVFESIKNDKLDLLIIPDAGTGDVIQCNELINNGTSVIILDHHEIIPILDGVPNRALIVNNQLSDKCNDKSMTGVGIVYKTIKKIEELLNNEPDEEKIEIADDYLDLLAVGMIADRCDLTNLQSRYYVLKGIEQMKNKTNKNPFIKHMIDKLSYSMNNNVTITGIAYYICPLINSMIRLGEFEQLANMYNVLCGDDKTTVVRKIRGKGEVEIPLYDDVYRDCVNINKKQKSITEESFETIQEQINEHHLDDLPVLICNTNNEMNKNFTGLIANVIAGNYKRPCLLLSQNEDMLSGSGRGFDKSQIRDFNKWCKETGLFTKVEGHSNAFGTSIPLSNIPFLIDKLVSMEFKNELVYHVYNEYNDTNIDSEIIKRIYKYNHLWNNGIDEPLFYVSNICCHVQNIELKGKNNNVLTFPYRNMVCTHMSKKSLLPLYNDIKKYGDNIRFDIVCKFSYDNYNKKPMMLIEDMNFSEDKLRISNPFGGF